MASSASDLRSFARFADRPVLSLRGRGARSLRSDPPLRAVVALRDRGAVGRVLARSACVPALCESSTHRAELRTGWKLWGREWARVLRANAHDEAAAFAWVDRVIESAVSNLEFSLALGVPGVSGTFALKVKASAAFSCAFVGAALAARCGLVSVWARRVALSGGGVARCRCVGAGAACSCRVLRFVGAPPQVEGGRSVVGAGSGPGGAQAFSRRCA